MSGKRIRRHSYSMWFGGYAKPALPCRLKAVFPDCAFAPVQNYGSGAENGGIVESYGCGRKVLKILISRS